MTSTKWMGLGFLCFLAQPVIVAAQGAPSGPSCSTILADKATASRVELVTGTNILSGELLETAGDGHLIIQCKTVKLALAPDSRMRVFQSELSTSVEVERGIVDYSAPGQSEDLSLYGLDAKIVPDTKLPAIGEVDVSSNCEMSVQSTKGKISVKSDRETKTVEESKGYDVRPKLGVDYSDDWRPVPVDYPDYPREAKYHESHHHVACLAAPLQNAATKAPLITTGALHGAATIGVMSGVGLGIWLVDSESPSKPKN